MMWAAWKELWLGVYAGLAAGVALCLIGGVYLLHGFLKVRRSDSHYTESPMDYPEERCRACRGRGMILEEIGGHVCGRCGGSGWDPDL